MWFEYIPKLNWKVVVPQLISCTFFLFTDINECQYGSHCTNGRCENTEGSFRCFCAQGFKLSASKDQCEGKKEYY